MNSKRIAKDRAIPRMARARLANLKRMPPPPFLREKLAAKFMKRCNEYVPGLYWDQEGALEEFEFLAELAQHVFGIPIISCIGCSKLILPEKESRGWCSVACAKDYRDFCREERRRERKSELGYQEQVILREEMGHVPESVN